MVGLVQARRIRVIVLVVQLLLQFTLFLGRLPRVLGQRDRVDVVSLVHVRPPPTVCNCFPARISHITRFKT